jgi:hypothetical protein
LNSSKSACVICICRLSYQGCERVKKRFENSGIIEFRHIKDTRYGKIITGNAQDVLCKIEWRFYVFNKSITKLYDVLNVGYGAFGITEIDSNYF